MKLLLSMFIFMLIICSCERKMDASQKSDGESNIVTDVIVTNGKYMVEAGANSEESIVENSIKNSGSISKKSEEEEIVTREYNLMGYSSEGGVIFANYNSGSLVNIEVLLFGESGKMYAKYLEKSMDNIDVTVISTTYKKPITESNGEVEIATEQESKYTIEMNSTIPKDHEWIVDLYRAAKKEIDTAQGDG